MSIHEFINDLRLIDNHAHPVEPGIISGDGASFSSYFTEGNLSPEHARHTLNYRAALEILEKHLDGDSEDSLLSERASVDLPSYSKQLIGQTNTETILVDDGFPDVTPQEFKQYTDASIHPILRIDSLAEKLLPEHNTFKSFEIAFENRIKDALTTNYVALKSIIAYRSGLNVGNPTQAEAAAAYIDVRSNWNGRLTDGPLLDYLTNLATDIAGMHNAPIQFHTGFGDADAHPRFANPTFLFDFLLQHKDTDIVLLHASYPYVRNAGYVTATLDNVFLDISLAVPFVQHGCEEVISQVLELAPSTKILYGSDAFCVPELYLLAEQRTRTDLSTVLNRLHQNGYITESYAETIAKNILRENARRLYDL